MNDKQWQKEAWAKDVPGALAEKLDGFEVDDEKTPTLKMAVDEARYIVGLHNESGTVSSGMLAGEYGKEDQKLARQTIKQCNAFIKKHSAAAQQPVKPLVTVRVGQVWKDLDTRMNGRRRRVHAIEGHKAVMRRPDRDTGVMTRVALARLEKGQGWALETDCP